MANFPVTKYREGIWKFEVSTSASSPTPTRDEFVHKSFEIAGCGGFLLAERSEGHMQRFREDEEAVFFSTIEECVEKVRRYLPDEATPGSASPLAGNALRQARDGYHNDRQVGLIIERIQSILSARKATSISANSALAGRP